MKLSIIIPYHNSDPWIGAMLDSLLDQDLPREDYEIVVVDDGSTEEPVTLHRYAEAHANIRVFRQENAGVAVARNTGLDKASGQWVWFCDSDDYVQPRVLGRLLAIADAQQLDMLWFDAVYVRQGELAREPRLDFSAVSPVQTGWDYVVNPPAKMGMAVWRYLFRRELLAEGPLRFHPLNYVEGRWFQMELMPRVQRAAHVAADIYFYVQHSSSLLHASKAKNYAQFADEMAKYVGVMAAKAADPAVPRRVQELLRQRCDLETYRLLGNVSRYGTPALADSYFTKLKALGTWPVRISGGLKERFLRRAMNCRGLWLAAWRFYHLVHRRGTSAMSLVCLMMLATCCCIRLTPEGGEQRKPGASSVDETGLVRLNQALAQGDSVVALTFRKGRRSGTYSVKLSDGSAFDLTTQTVAVDYDSEGNAFRFRLRGGGSAKLPLVAGYTLLRTDVPEEAFYKDIFLDAGIGLTSRTSLYAADSLGLSLEGISFSNKADKPEEFDLQRDILSGTAEDRNGRLLYPDGQPRYRLLFVNGGNSRTHGQSLDSLSRANMRLFVQAGGSYVGTCAGAFLASTGYDSTLDYPYYLGIWPAPMWHTTLKHVYTGMYIDDGSPLLEYADYGGDGYVAGIRHNGGGFPREYPEGTEVLAVYDYPGLDWVHKKPSVWAYKADAASGRVVLEGSHPEEVPDGEQLALTEALIGYAFDGQGTASIKAFLHNAEALTMDRDSWEGEPEKAKLGDRQCHHFAVYVPADARHIRFSVESPAACSLQLRLCRETFAFPSKARYASGDDGARQYLAFDTLEEGIWYVSVQCLTTVTTVPTSYGQDYVGRTDVLNGVPYTISVSWESDWQ